MLKRLCPLPTYLQKNGMLVKWKSVEVAIRYAALSSGKVGALAWTSLRAEILQFRTYSNRPTNNNDKDNSNYMYFISVIIICS